MEERKILTPAEARAALEKTGLSIAEWSRRNGVSMRAVYDMLLGRSIGKYGECHRAAVLLGLKEGLYTLS